MPMKVTIEVNGAHIEVLKITRFEALIDDDPNAEYTYKVQYKRLKRHRTHNIRAPKFVYIKHKFSDGSLMLLRNAIDEILRQAVRQRLP